MKAKLIFEREDQDHESTVLRVKGDVTIHTSPSLREQLKPLFSSQQKRIHILLNDVDFMDSSGIATLVEGLQWARQSGGRFVLSGLSDNVRDIFELSKLDTIFDIENSTA
ncbi:MAG: STAS domain-containing protein [Mariprofundus sp.]|nr:STAS domain-containing protein [Mariprofundus sp.]